MNVVSSIWARSLRGLAALCVLVPILAYATGAGTTDARAVWVALAGSVLKISPIDGTVGLTLGGTPSPQGFAVDPVDEDVWLYSNKSLESFDLQGNLLLNVALPNNFHGGAPDGMAVDDSAGSIWIAIQKDLYRLDMAGNLQADINLGSNTVGLSLDMAQSRLWVAEQGGIEVFDASGTRLFAVTSAKSAPPSAIAYDKSLNQAWVAYSSGLTRYDNSGNSVAQATLASGLGGFIAVDGQGGLWVAGGQNIAYINSSNQTQFVLQPFSGEDGGSVLALVADPLNHSAWAVNARHLREFGTNGALIKEVTLSLPPGNGQAIQNLGMFVDTIPPTVTISAPPDFTYTNHNQPGLTLSYSDIGSGVDPTSIVVTNDGTAIPETCQANTDDSGAVCVPNAALSDGGYNLSVTVKDMAGNVSRPASVTLTVDTVPPTITITNPTASTTAISNLTITGSLSEAGNLSINGTNVTVNPDFSFSETMTLKPGPNTLTFVAMDLAGNTASVVKTVTLQSMPLGGLAGDLVQFQPGGTGIQTLIGQVGAATPGETVTVMDVNSGQSASGTVNADGSISVSLPGAATDDYSVTLTGAGVNQPQTFYMHANDTAMQLVITSPTSGSSINGDNITVTGTYSGPLNSGITVNGQAAVVANGQFFANNIQLAPGSNTLTVTATTGGNLTVTQTVIVTSVGISTLVVTANSNGMTPFKANFQIGFSGSTSLDEVDISLGDGNFRTYWGFELNTNPPFYIYQIPGVYTVTVTAYDDKGAQYQSQLMIAVQDPAQPDALFTGVWSDVTGALTAGNKAAAMSLLDPTAQHNYGSVFDTLMPNMKAIVGSFSPLMQSSVNSGTAEYAVARIRNGQAYLYLVDFVQGADGVWRLDSM